MPNIFYTKKATESVVQDDIYGMINSNFLYEILGLKTGVGNDYIVGVYHA